MKKTTVIALLGLILSVTACTTEDPTPPGELVGAGAPTDRVGDVGEQGDDSAQESAPGDSAQESAPADGPEGTAAPEAAADPVCEALFGGAQTLLGRVATSRGLIAAGDQIEEGRVGEFAKERELLEGLTAQASGEQAGAIEQLGEPLVLALDAVESGEVQEAEGAGDIILPQIDVSGSVAAQDQLAASCEG